MLRKITQAVRRRLHAIMPAAVVLFAAACASQSPEQAQDPERQTLQTLSGVYVSAAPEPWYGGYGTRRFEFDDGQWSLVFDFALDPQMTQRVFTFRTYGPYQVLDRSAAEPRAFEAVFTESAKFVTWYPDNPAMIQQFGMANCGLEPGREQDISVSGCAGWPPVSACGEDHDLFGLDAAGGLLFGVRPPDNNMCTPDRRPTQLLAPVVRQG
jgi:hypothetical protein